nr:MAG TPA: hypothetical protein [Bacteriophage sp.]
MLVASVLFVCVFIINRTYVCVNGIFLPTGEFPVGFNIYICLHPYL